MSSNYIVVARGPIPPYLAPKVAKAHAEAVKRRPATSMKAAGPDVADHASQRLQRTGPPQESEAASTVELDEVSQ